MGDRGNHLDMLLGNLECRGDGGVGEDRLVGGRSAEGHSDSAVQVHSDYHLPVAQCHYCYYFRAEDFAPEVDLVLELNFRFDLLTVYHY